MIKYTILFGVFFTTATLFSQDKKKSYIKAKESPVYFMDSLNVAENELLKYDKNIIALVTIYKDQEALDIIGEQGKDGLIYIETIPFARNRYWRYFSSKSEGYAKIAPTKSAEEKIQYILNGEMLTKDFEGKLALIDNNTFQQLIVLDKETLTAKYGVQDKEYGIELTAVVEDE